MPARPRRSGLTGSEPCCGSSARTRRYESRGLQRPKVLDSDPEPEGPMPDSDPKVDVVYDRGACRTHVHPFDEPAGRSCFRAEAPSPFRPRCRRGASSLLAPDSASARRVTLLFRVSRGCSPFARAAAGHPTVASAPFPAASVGTDFARLPPGRPVGALPRSSLRTSGFHSWCWRLIALPRQPRPFASRRGPRCLHTASVPCLLPDPVRSPLELQRSLGVPRQNRPASSRPHL